MAKQVRNTFPSGISRRASSCLQLIHMDLCGPMSEESLGGNMYFYLFVDYYSRWCWVFFLKNKSESFEKFENFHSLMERQTGMKFKTLRSDRGGEFFAHEFQRYYNRLGIKREFTAPYSPQQNGVMEHKNRIMVEMARGQLKSGELPVKFWGENVSTAVHLINKSPTQALHNKTPYEVWHVVKPTISYLRVFGCVVFTLISSHRHQKLNDKSEICMFIGCCPESKAYKLYNPITCKVIVDRDVVFHEGSQWNWEARFQGEQVISIVEAIEDPASAFNGNFRSGDTDADGGKGVTTSEEIPMVPSQTPQII